MQSPRSPLDWHNEEDTSEIDALDEVQERMMALEKRLQNMERTFSKHMKKGLIGGLLHCLDIMLRNGVEILLQSHSVSPHI